MKTRLHRRELLLLLGAVTLALTAIGLKHIPQDQAYHHFVDARSLLGIPRFMDVVTNIGFALAGVWGLALWLKNRLEFGNEAMRTSALVFFVGMLLTSGLSAFYHWAPNDAGLAMDRLGMTVVFAGVLGMVASQRVSPRAGIALLSTALVAGPLAIGAWQLTASVGPYAVVQFGGMALALLCLLAKPACVGPHWGFLLAVYVLAKVAEGMDAQVFGWTGGMLSGHSLKHLLAALPALAVGLPLLRTPLSNQLAARRASHARGRFFCRHLQ